jgi:DNA (cytosine-5)-methyltransferase 1
LNVLDLFSGIGGFSLGLERAGMRTVAFCEIERYARAVLAKHWPRVPIYPDVRELSATRLAADGITVDVICGGFPCTDVSSSGTKVGLKGESSGLWYEYQRLVREIRPRYIIVENVSDLLYRGMGDVLGGLAEIGYDAEWHSVGASFVGLPQARERVWIVAYPNDGRRWGSTERYGYGPLVEFRPDDDRLDMGQSWAREATSRVRRGNYGIPSHVDRLRCLGNAVVPQIPEIIGRAIMRAAHYSGAVQSE